MNKKRRYLGTSMLGFVMFVEGLFPGAASAATGPLSAELAQARVHEANSKLGKVSKLWAAPKIRQTESGLFMGHRSHSSHRSHRSHYSSRRP